jgi:hypothetical protein
LAQDAIACSRRKVGVGKFIVDVEAQIVEDTVPFAINVAQRVPGGVFEEHPVEAIEAILVVDVWPDFAGVGMLRCGDRTNIQSSSIFIAF